MIEQPILHVYAQAFWHEEAVIVGNREALLTLRATIDAALQSGGEWNGVSSEVSTADGEGYAIRVRRMDDEAIDKLILPYTDKDAAGNRDGDQP